MPHSITRLALPMLGLCAAAFAVPALAQTTLDKIRLYAVSESHQLSPFLRPTRRKSPAA